MTDTLTVLQVVGPAKLGIPGEPSDILVPEGATLTIDGGAVTVLQVTGPARISRPGEPGDILVPEGATLTFINGKPDVEGLLKALFLPPPLSSVRSSDAR